MKVYFVARTSGSEPDRVTQGVVERRLWVALKKELAADGFVITYWNLVDDDVVTEQAA